MCDAQSVQTPPSLLDLPDEILIRIFGFLRYEEAISVLGRVCRRFKRLCQDKIVWRFVRLSKKSDADSVLLDHLKNCILLSTLIVDDRPKDGEDLVKMTLKQCRQLKVLIIRLSDIGDSLFETIKQFGTSLKVLSVTYLSPKERRDIALRGFPRLKKLFLRQANFGVGDHQRKVRIFEEGDSSWAEDLEVMETHGILYLDHDLLKLLKRVKSKLRAIRVDIDSSSTEIARELSQCEHLEAIEQSYYSFFTVEMTTMWIKEIFKLKRLVKLTVNIHCCPDIGDEIPLASLPSLRSLNLNCQNLELSTEAPCKFFASACPNLEEFIWKGIVLSEETIVFVLNVCPNLVIFDCDKKFNINTKLKRRLQGMTVQKRNISKFSAIFYDPLSH